MRPASTTGRDLFWWTLRAHWAFGPVLLLFTTDIARGALVAAFAAFAAGTWLDRIGASRAGWGRAAPYLVAVLLLASAADLFLGSRDLLVSASLLVLGIQAILLMLPKRPRDGWQLCAISFLEFLAAAASTTEIRFVLFAFVFMGLSVGALWELHASHWREEGGAPMAVPPRLAAAVILLGAAGGFLLTAILFAVTPRIGFGQIARHLARPTGLSGFSDTISLRDVTAVKADRRVVARVEFPERAAGLDPGGLHLRGTAYSRFDGSRWTRSAAAALPVSRGAFLYLLGTPTPGVPLSVAEITLEPMDHPALFVYGAPVTIEGSLGTILSDEQGGYAFAQSGHPAVRYRLRFGERTTRAARGGNTPLAEDLALPPGSEEIRALANRVTAGARPDAERAGRAVRFFRSGFRYTLSEPAGGVREFLFGTRAGYCEHFATALCLLLRASGIPARVAAGYLGGEWSDVGDYLIVRQSDAHAWTEGWIDGRWVTLDATPPAGRSALSSPTGMLGMYVDWIRQRWNKYVVNYSLRMQAEAVSAGWSAFRWLPRRIAAAARGPAWRSARFRAVSAAVFLAAAAAALYALARRSASADRARAGGSGPGEPLSRPYRRLVRALERRGYRRAPGFPLEEMLRGAVSDRADLSSDAERFLPLYHRDRFGARPLTPEEGRDAAARAARIGAGLRRRDAS